MKYLLAILLITSTAIAADFKPLKLNTQASATHKNNSLCGTVDMQLLEIKAIPCEIIWSVTDTRTGEHYSGRKPVSRQNIEVINIFDGISTWDETPQKLWPESLSAP